MISIYLSPDKFTHLRVKFESEFDFFVKRLCSYLKCRQNKITSVVTSILTSKEIQYSTCFFD